MEIEIFKKEVWVKATTLVFSFHRRAAVTNNLVLTTGLKT